MGRLVPAEDLRRELRLSKTPGKNGAERRAEPRLTKGEHKAAGGWSSNWGWFLSWSCLVGGPGCLFPTVESEDCHWQRVSRCGLETPLVGRSACHSPPPRPHRDSGENSVRSFPNPVRPWRRAVDTCRREARARRPRRRGSELRSPRKDDTLREVATSIFFWGFV